MVARRRCFRCLPSGNGALFFRCVLWMYQNVALFRKVTDLGYRTFVARNRTLFSVGTRWLWGTDVRQPTYFTARAWYSAPARRHLLFSRSFRCACRWMA